MALLQQQVKDQQNRYEAGTVPRFNVLQAEVQLANALPPLIQAQNAYRISTYQLVRLLGMDYPRGHPSEVPFNVVGTLGYSPRRIDTDESIRVAIARNPSLKAQRQAILSNAANVNVQIAGWFPTINANAGYEFVNDIGFAEHLQQRWRLVLWCDRHLEYLGRRPDVRKRDAGQGSTHAGQEQLR